MAAAAQPRIALPSLRLGWGGALPWGLAAFVLLLLIGPVVFMAVFTFAPPSAITVNDVLADPTLDNYASVFAETSTYRLLWNTILYGFGSIILGLLIALTLAWLMERTDMPGRNAFYGLMFIPMAIPPFATAIGWILLMGKNAGLINRWIRDLTPFDGLQGPLNVFSIWGLVFVTGLAIAPTMWLLLLGVLRNMDPSLEEAGQTAGFGRLGVLRRITLPLMRPGLLGVVAYYGVVVIAIFEIPLAIGLRSGIHVLSTKLFLLTRSAVEGDPNYGVAAAFGLISVAFALVFVIIYVRALRDSSRFAVVSGKAYRPRRIKLGKWRWVALGVVSLYFLLQVVLPFMVLAWSSFLKFYQPPSLSALSSLTLDQYRELFATGRMGQSLTNTAIVVVVAATFTMLLASVISWHVVRRPSFISRTLNVLAFMPLALPGVVIAVAFLILFIRTPLYGTLALMIMAYVLAVLAFTSRLTNAAQIQLDKSLEEAAVTSGMSPVTSFFRITLPLMFPALINGWMWAAVHIMRNFTIPLFLAGFGSPLIANVIYVRFAEGGTASSTPPIVILVFIVVALALLSQRVFRRQLAPSE